MSLPKVVSPDEWLVARKELLLKEKELTRHRDAVNIERRNLPMVKIDKEYVFEGPGGPVSLLDLFDGRRQLIVGHFMFDPSWDDGCPSCSAGADEISDGLLQHLHTRDTTFVYVSRAPLAKLEDYKRRKGWTFLWFSSYGSDFNYDFHVTLDDSVAPVEYNYRTREEHERAGTPVYVEGEQPIEDPGRSCFLRVDDTVFQYLFRLCPRPRVRGRLVLLPRRDRARAAGGLGGAEGAGGGGTRRRSQLRVLTAGQSGSNGTATPSSRPSSTARVTAAEPNRSRTSSRTASSAAWLRVSKGRTSCTASSSSRLATATPTSVSP
jgi:predicted dithiol-disulfide oxidoreductase (DUF899 family)